MTPEEFVTEVNQLQDGLRCYLFHLLGNWDTADELTQETLTRSFAALESFDAGRCFRNWIFGIATNAAHDLGRKNTRPTSTQSENETDTTAGKPQRVARQRFFSEGESQSLVATTPDGLECLLQTERRHAVQEAIQKLPDELRTVFVLFYFEDLSYKEIEELLELSHETVAGRLNRARVILRNNPHLKNLLENQ